MMFREKMGVRSVRLALGLLSGLVAAQAFAQEQPMQRVEVTGSAIKRINVEGALPIQTLSQETIAKTGATNVAELIQTLPAMQGFTISAIAAGSNSGGRVSASIHDIGESYTLVLLNGRRLAPQGSGSSVNLQAIPLSAVERVEILTDGASALYGSDAIAGVINFVLKRNQQGAEIEANYSTPTSNRAGDSKYVAATYGFGDLDTQGFNVLLSYRHDDQSQVRATDRDFAKTAYLPFEYGGKNYIYDRTSAATIPANVTVTFNNPAVAAAAFSPYLRQNGNCPELNFPSLTNTAAIQNCSFDFVTQVEIVPENKRDSLFLKGTLKLSDTVSVFSDIAYSRFDLTARIASNTAPFTILPTSAEFAQYVNPYLTPAQRAAGIRSVAGNYRTYDWGTRDSQTITESKHAVVGADIEVANWNVNTALTWSQNAIDERYVGGYAKNTEFRAMLANRSFDPFAPIGAQSAATQQLIENSIFHGSIREASTTLKAADLRASRELFAMAGGAAAVAVGADYREYAYDQQANATAADIYNFNTSPAYDMKRDNVGAFTELRLPLAKQIELNAALRYDKISAIDDSIQKRKFGKDQSKSTYKISARYQPTQQLLFRGSYGTGFKAPSMLDIAQPLVNAGFTAGNFECPIADATLCRPGRTQYNVVSSGNENLKPETSKQFTIGARYEPNNRLSLGLDLWDVKMRDAVSAVSEQQAFANPVLFRDLFTTYTEPSTGNTYWAFRSSSTNIGRTHNRGIDWDVTGRYRFGFGNLTATLNGTHTLKSDYTRPGTSDDWTNSMNYFGINNAVTFKNIARLITTLDTGSLSNSIIVNYRNGYTDAAADVRDVAANATVRNFRLEVPSFTTFDWQARFRFNEALTLRAGIKNLFDREPPLSLRNSSGHQVGFDPRYADPLGRQAYLTGNYKF
ncbi:MULTISPECIES: TonB-dependent receptor [unclassified Massilia]|uniref:TonB-dependent receptor n=1 Tax=unclassified Massilia TaxID=2609279 RepID=UPI001782710F|nr:MULTISPECIES: TonB-dependent receptor [unclassified Massilia]MBD8529059.1 TonB-dependent receptor [Massilia sp. CFBP 13647]MBD8672453.1 TonB-dependent receptor [Massilia sp. CFBP 13721]